MAYLSCAKDNEYPLLLIFNLQSPPLFCSLGINHSVAIFTVSGMLHFSLASLSVI